MEVLPLIFPETGKGDDGSNLAALVPANGAHRFEADSSQRGNHTQDTLIDIWANVLVTGLIDGEQENGWCWDRDRQIFRAARLNGDKPRGTA